MFINNLNLKSVKLSSFVENVNPFNWQIGTLPISRNWIAGVTTTNEFILFAEYSGSAVEYVVSSNITSWTTRSFSASITYNSAAYVTATNEIALLGNTNFRKSSDIITWDSYTIPWSTWTNLINANGILVAISTNQGRVIYSTNNGNSFTNVNLLNSYIRSTLAYGNNTFVSISYNNNNVITSNDAILWTSNTLGYNGNYSTLTYGNNIFVSLQENANKFLYSSDGINWTQGTLPISTGCRCLKYNNGFFLGISLDGSEYVYSQDGINWQTNILPVNGNYKDILFIDNQWVIFKPNSNQYLYSV